MKKLLITLCAIGLMLGPVQGQMQGPGDGTGTGEGGPMYEGPPPLLEVDPEVLAEINELRDALKVLREELNVSRTAVITALGTDATREEKIAAMTAWHEDNADTIEEMQALSEELRTLIQENRPARPDFDIPDNILADREALKSRRIALADSRREAILALGDDPTDEAVREAIETWRTENTVEIEAVKELAKSIRDWFRDNRPGRGGRVMTPGMKQRREFFQANVAAMHQNRQQLRMDMQNAQTAEERKALMKAFREEQQSLMQQRKQLKREERIQLGEGGGDRRPGG